MPKDIQIQTVTLDDVSNVGIDVQGGKITAIHMNYTLKDASAKRWVTTGSDYKLEDLGAGDQTKLTEVVTALLPLVNTKEGTT
jgi:hypothetical protein